MQRLANKADDILSCKRHRQDRHKGVCTFVHNWAVIQLLQGAAVYSVSAAAANTLQKNVCAAHYYP
eukprot:12447-Heterococcus_DN1.PRE.2